MRRAQRRAYKASRLLGDVNAAQRGRLPQRLIRRHYHRLVIGTLRKWGLW